MLKGLCIAHESDGQGRFGTPVQLTCFLKKLTSRNNFSNSPEDCVVITSRFSRNEKGKMNLIGSKIRTLLSEFAISVANGNCSSKLI